MTGIDGPADRNLAHFEAVGDVTLSPRELWTLEGPLAEAILETKQYLSRYGGTDVEHDECCPRHASRDEVRAEQRAALQQRLDQQKALYHRIGGRR